MRVPYCADGTRTRQFLAVMPHIIMKSKQHCTRAARTLAHGTICMMHRRRVYEQDELNVASPIIHSNSVILNVHNGYCKLYVTIRSISSAGQPAWLYLMHAAVEAVSQHGTWPLLSLPTRLALRGQELYARLAVAGSASIRYYGCIW